MTDGLPTDEQLRRIERGVQRSIDLRRAVAHRIAGTTAAVALLGGGIALLVPLVAGRGIATSGAGSSGGGTAASAAAVEPVVCHASSARDSDSVQQEAPAGADDRRLIEACGAAAVEFQSGSGRMPTASPGPEPQAADGSESASPTPSPRGGAVLCEATDGVLHVFPADERPSTLCTRNGMRAR